MNLQRLTTALKPLNPALRGAPSGLPFVLDPPTVKAGLNFTLITDAGDMRFHYSAMNPRPIGRPVSKPGTIISGPSKTRRCFRTITRPVVGAMSHGSRCCTPGSGWRIHPACGRRTTGRFLTPDSVSWRLKNRRTRQRKHCRSLRAVKSIFQCPSPPPRRSARRKSRGSPPRFHVPKPESNASFMAGLKRPLHLAT